MSGCDGCPSQGTCGKNENECGIKINPNNRIKKVVAVMSGKGGVGKSTMTTLLAKAAQSKGLKVGVLDADITGPSIPRLFGLQNEKAYGDGDKQIYPVVDKDGIKTMSINYLIDQENTPVIWRGPIVAGAIQQFWNDVLWGDLDVLFIDMPPGTGDVALTIMQTLPVTGVIMVSTPQPMVSMIVTKAINMLAQMNVPVLGVIENMSYVVCPDCGKKIEVYENNVDEFIKENHVPLLAELPFNNGVSHLNHEDSISEKDTLLIKEWILPIIDNLFGDLMK